jgi:hypothetical protein
VGQALARTGCVEIAATTAGIRISEGYHAYLRAVEFYHSWLRRELREEGVPNIREVLREGREETLDEFKKESNDAGYLLRITEHLEQTEEKLIEENNKVLDLRNLAFLRQASDGLLARASAGRLPAEQLQGEVETIVSDYKLQANGDNKYEILTNYLNVLHTAVGKYPLPHAGTSPAARPPPSRRNSTPPAKNGTCSRNSSNSTGARTAASAAKLCDYSHYR